MIAYLGDGSLVVGNDTRLERYQPGSIEPEVLAVLDHEIAMLVASPDGTTIAVNTKFDLGAPVSMWLVSTVSGARRVPTPPGSWWEMGFADDSTLYSVTLDGAGDQFVGRVDVASATMTASALINGAPNSVLPLPDGRVLVGYLASGLSVVAPDLQVGATLAIKGLSSSVFTLTEAGELIGMTIDGLAELDLRGTPGIGEPLETGGTPLFGQAYASADGTSVLVAPDAVEWQRYDARTLEPNGSPFKPVGLALGWPRLTSDGALVAYSTGDRVNVQDTATGEVKWSSPVMALPFAVEFSPDDRKLAVGEVQGVQLFDVATGKEDWSARANVVSVMSWSPDSSKFSVNDSSRPRLLDVDTGDESFLDGEGQAIFAPDGRHVAIAGTELTIFDLVDGTSRVLRGGEGLFAGYYSRDSRTIFGVDITGRLAIIDVESGEAIGPRMKVAKGVTEQFETESIAVMGNDFLVGGRGSPVVRYHNDADRWVERACAQAGRNLSRAEWDSYLGQIDDYRSTCAEYPAGL